jgi:hypothetical protein
MTKATSTPANTDPAAARRRAGLGEVDTTQPIDQRTSGAAIVKATSDGRSYTDHAYGDLIDIVRHAETQVFEAQTTVQLQAELDNARRQEGHREHVDPETIRRIKALADSWETQRGLNGNRDGTP